MESNETAGHRSDILTAVRAADSVAGMPRASSAAARPRQRASDAPNPSFASTLARGLQILDAFRPGESWLSNSELASRTGLSRPTVSRLAGTLIQLGFMSRGNGGRYRLGMRLLGLTYPLLASFRVRQLARPLMRDFAEQAGGAVSIGVAQGPHLVYIETARTAQPFPHIPEIGFSSPLYSTSGGRAAMSLMTEAELETVHGLVERQQPEIFGRMRRSALAGIADCRKQGFCVAAGDWRPEIFATGAPLVRTTEGDCLALNCGIPSYRVTAQQMQEVFGPRILGLARAIRGLLERDSA